MASSLLVGFDGYNGAKIEYDDIRVVTYLYGNNLDQQRQKVVLSAKGEIFNESIGFKDWTISRTNLSKKGKTSHKDIKRIVKLSDGIQAKLRDKKEDENSIILPLIAYLVQEDCGKARKRGEANEHLVFER